jgi:hypothetical protein
VLLEKRLGVQKYGEDSDAEKKTGGPSSGTEFSLNTCSSMQFPCMSLDLDAVFLFTVMSASSIQKKQANECVQTCIIVMFTHHNSL